MRDKVQWKNFRVTFSHNSFGLEPFLVSLIIHFVQLLIIKNSNMKIKFVLA